MLRGVVALWVCRQSDGEGNGRVGGSVGGLERFACLFFWICEIREKSTHGARSGNLTPVGFLVNKIQAHIRVRFRVVVLF